MLPIIGAIAGTVGSVFKSWLETRKVKAEGKIKLAQARVDARVKKEEQKGEMDIQSMKGMQYSWKDEYLLVLMSGPIIMAFIPPLAEYALRGFEIVNQMPDWYKWAWTGIVAATFGLRTWTGFKK